MANAMAPAAK